MRWFREISIFESVWLLHWLIIPISLFMSNIQNIFLLIAGTCDQFFWYCIHNIYNFSDMLVRRWFIIVMLSQPSHPYNENPYPCEMVTLYLIGPGDRIHTLHISDFMITDGSLFRALWRKWNNETSLYLNSYITVSYRVAWCTIYMSFWSAGCHLYGNKPDHIKMALWCPLGNIMDI